MPGTISDCDHVDICSLTILELRNSYNHTAQAIDLVRVILLLPRYPVLAGSRLPVTHNQTSAGRWNKSLTFRHVLDHSQVGTGRKNSSNNARPCRTPKPYKKFVLITRSPLDDIMLDLNAAGESIDQTICESEQLSVTSDE
ncbi:hypothetical protein I7I51_04056 [Histoplasma capsulatum]|uniref:Uncharacterized protein n=1 Tax=Ajellomyces capsulatus TaxID=5037 RepID=A0A8A1M780_AJECA|nr:hypothetical protein I7I51_04056 [Histoplasma capsulatum]